MRIGVAPISANSIRIHWTSRFRSCESRVRINPAWWRSIWAKALEADPEIVKQALEIPAPGASKFVALNSALWQTGALIYVRAGCQVELPDLCDIQQ